MLKKKHRKGLVPACTRLWEDTSACGAWGMRLRKSKAGAVNGEAGLTLIPSVQWASPKPEVYFPNFTLS